MDVRIYFFCNEFSKLKDTKHIQTFRIPRSIDYFLSPVTVSMSHKRTDTSDTQAVDLVGLDVSSDDDSSAAEQVMYHPGKNLSGETIEETLSEEHHEMDRPEEAKEERNDKTGKNEPEEDERFSFWGGSMVDSIKGHNGVVSKFSEDHMGPHGLYSSFAYSNGWLRTLSYFVMWVGTAWFFFFLSIPLIKGYNDREVVTTIDVESAQDGLPLPIITVCPHGRGTRCDCTLWRRLYCRYQKKLFETNDTIYEDWTERFSDYACYYEFKNRFENERRLETPGTFDSPPGTFDDITSYPNLNDDDDWGKVTNPIDVPPPVWADPKCEDFEDDNYDDSSGATVPDVCGYSKEDLYVNPGLSPFTGEELYKKIVERESGKDGPYITNEEQILYAPVNISDRVLFTQEKSRIQRHAKQVPDSWIRTTYIEWSRLQLCVQVRPPPSIARQRVPGINNGLAVLVTGINSTDYPLFDVANAASAVDVHVNVIPDELYNRTTLPIEPQAFTTVQSGSITSISYLRERWMKSKGWGERASRTCEDIPVPRGLCVHHAILSLAGEQCNCTLPDRSYEVAFNVEVPAVFGCSAIDDTEQAACVARLLPELYDTTTITLDECPIQCERYEQQITSRTTTKISEGQMLYFKQTLAADNRDTDIDVESTAYVRIGLESLFTTVNSEQPKTTLGALMGQLGGNAGLWCGLSFTMLMEVMEFITVAILYGRGFYRPRRHSLRWWLSRKLKKH